MGQDFDFIATITPVDRTAARVLQKGEHYDPVKPKEVFGHSDTPLPTERFRGPASWDMTGVRFGLFVVIGVAPGQLATGLNTRWVVRCQCGAFEYRRTRAIKNQENAHIDRCAVCRDLAWLRNHSTRVREVAKEGKS